MQKVIKVENLGKKYRLGAKKRNCDTLREMLVTAAKAPVRRYRELRGNTEIGEDTTFWALKDVSFEVLEGEVVGIIGRNGAGKSTILKVLSRITEPTEGRVKVKGRVASLLEVGTGFSPELTGRENIYLNGSILGMSRAEINRKFDEIVDFSEMERFLDTPVKRYSSGMYVRLAFAVAAHLEPEILIVDEVLAVGDSAFQKKCLGKMRDVSKIGRTVLFVSHNMGAVKQMCTRGLVLSQGRLLCDDTTDRAIETYIASGSKIEEGMRSWGDPPPGKRIWPISIEMRNGSGKTVTSIGSDQHAVFDLILRVLEPTTFQVSFRVINGNEIPIFTTEPGPEPLHYDRGCYRFCCELPSSLLSPGAYRLHVGIHYPWREIYFVDEHAISWVVEDTGSNMARYGRYTETGVILMDTDWKTEQINENDQLLKVGAGLS